MNLNISERTQVYNSMQEWLWEYPDLTINAFRLDFFFAMVT